MQITVNTFFFVLCKPYTILHYCCRSAITAALLHISFANFSVHCTRNPTSRYCGLLAFRSVKITVSIFLLCYAHHTQYFAIAADQQSQLRCYKSATQNFSVHCTTFLTRNLVEQAFRPVQNTVSFIEFMNIMIFTIVALPHIGNRYYILRKSQSDTARQSKYSQ